MNPNQMLRARKIEDDAVYLCKMDINMMYKQARLDCGSRQRNRNEASNFERTKGIKTENEQTLQSYNV